jgi:hypothetical protein
MIRILLDWSSAHVRLALRVYFNVLLPLLGLIGDQCCKKRSQLRLLRGLPLEITQTTGWLRGTSAAYAMYSMRKSPAGWLGFVMILAGVFWLTADLVVSGLVVPVSVVDRCAFNTTGPYEVMVSPRTLGPYSVAPVGTVFDIVTEAQRTSKANGGLSGIFNKTNTDPSFRADALDIMGQWDCEQVGQDSIYPAQTSPTSISMDLESRGLLYDEWSSSATQFIGNNWYVQLLTWSSSVSDWADNLTMTAEEVSAKLLPWGVLAAVDMSTTPEAEKVMRSFNCTMDAPDLMFVLGKLQASTMLAGFSPSLKNNVYGYFTSGVAPVAELGAAIGSTLDAMIMLAGAYGAGINESAQPMLNPTQGCLAVKTQIPAPVILVWILVTTTMLAACALWLFLIVQIRILRKQPAQALDFAHENPPNGLLGWMGQSIQEAEPSKKVEPRSLGSWTLISSQNRQGLHLARKRQSAYGKAESFLDQASDTTSRASSAYEQILAYHQDPATTHRTVLRKAMPSEAYSLWQRPSLANVPTYAPLGSSYDAS